jgi:HEAT repeat protein
MTDDYDLILAGDAIDAIEAAKRLISADIADAARLRDIAVNRRNKDSARVAAIYALGFANDEQIAGDALLNVVADRDDTEQCRAHAAEALAHLDEPRATALLEKILTTSAESAEVKRWCVYALGEIGGLKARNVLRKFGKTNPIGVVENELRIALGRR